MGNKPEKLFHQSDVNGRAPPPLQSPQIPQNSFELFLKCIHDLPFTLSEEQFETITYDLKEKTFPAGSIIIKEGSMAAGVFVIVKGHCDVLASDKHTVIRNLEKESLFGEISCFYNKPCTCTVVSNNECKTILLGIHHIKKLMNHEPIPLNNWFLQKKYLDISNLFPVGEISSKVIKFCLMHAPVFDEWSESALSEVCKSITLFCIEVYPPDSIIYSADDEDAFGYLLLHGSVKLCDGDTLVCIIPETQNGTWFGDELLFCSSKRFLTAKAVTTCQIISLTPDYFSPVLKDFPTESLKLANVSKKWNTSLQQRNTNLYHQYLSFMNVTALNFLLNKTKPFQNVNYNFLYFLTLSIQFSIKQEGDKITEYSEDEDDQVVIIFKGSVDVHSLVSKEFSKLLPLDVFYLSPERSGVVKIVATEETLVGHVNRSAIESVMDIYPDTVIEW